MDTIAPMIAIYTTIASKQSAYMLANEAIAQKRAACVNIIPHIESIYEYSDECHHDNEIGMIFKTSNAQKENLCAWIENHHPYECPAIIILASEASNSFVQWIEKTLEQQ